MVVLREKPRISSLPAAAAGGVVIMIAMMATTTTTRTNSKRMGARPLAVLLLSQYIL